MRRVVVVSGAPGAGKSTLAVPLAKELGFPLLSKDAIKEALFDVLGQPCDDEVTSSRQLGAAAMELLWRLAAGCPAVVMEANFRRQPPHERERIRALSPHPVEVFCRVPLELAAKRYNERGSRSDHHPVHVVRSISRTSLTEFEEPLALGHVIEVDTSRPVAVRTVAETVREALSQASY